MSADYTWKFGSQAGSKPANFLNEQIPVGPKVLDQAIAARERMAREVSERSNPRTKATVNQLLDRYLDHFDGAAERQEELPYLRTNACATVHRQPTGRRGGRLDMLDSLYAELRRCRNRCGGSPRVDHRTTRSHTCDDRCKPHRCKPLGAMTIRHIHFLVSGALRRASLVNRPPGVDGPV